MLQFKDNNLLLKDIDLSKRTVTGYFAAFNNVDSDGDIILPGAFKKTLKENKERIQHLLQHNITHPIAKIMSLGEDQKGLLFTSLMSESTLGNDTLIQLQEGILREHSIGFSTIKEQRQDDHNELIELKLWEGSTVTFGANPNTPIVGIKTELEKEAEALKRLEVLEKFMKNGTVSDDAFRSIEFQIMHIKNILSLNIKKPDVNPLIKKEPMFDFDKLRTHLNN